MRKEDQRPKIFQIIIKTPRTKQTQIDGTVLDYKELLL